MKTLERFLNWLKEAKERILNWDSTLKGILIPVIAVLAALKVLPEDTIVKIQETIDIAAPTLVNVLSGIGVSVAAIIGLMQIWKKDN